MSLAQANPPAGTSRPIARRTRGRGHGPITRLMSPGDFGELLKPFVFLDLFDHEGPPFEGPVHPHSGIATLTYVAEGSINYVDPDQHRGSLSAGGVEWMQAGRGMWHGGGLDKPGRTRGFQLWVALPPELELGPTISRYQAPDEVPHDGPVRMLLGDYGAHTSPIAAPSPMTYLAVGLKAGDTWTYAPPAGHTVLWAAVATGEARSPEVLRAGDLAAFVPSEAAVTFEAVSDVEFVLGSAAPHAHDLVTGYYSVHTSVEALRNGEAQITAIRKRLAEAGVPNLAAWA